MISGFDIGRDDVDGGSDVCASARLADSPPGNVLIRGLMSQGLDQPGARIAVTPSPP